MKAPPLAVIVDTILTGIKGVKAAWGVGFGSVTRFMPGCPRDSQGTGIVLADP